MIQLRSLRLFCVNSKRFKSSQTKNWPKRIFSGIQPTGTLHVGNYFGAVQKWKESVDCGDDVILSIVDLHAITLPQDVESLKLSVLRMTASLLACGIDADKCILFQQSKVPHHALLGWVLGTMTTMTRLYHFPQYKEKSSALKDIPLGLFTYPVLQAADILLYKSTLVPVGEDQVQHINLAQHLVHNFNNRFGETFPFPEYVLPDKFGAGRIKSLREPDKKMSKSHADPKSRIDITDSSKDVLNKIKKAVTDFTSEVTYEPETRPGVSNLVDIHCLITGKSPDEICREAAGIETGKYKLVVAEALNAKLSPIRAELGRLMDSREFLDDVLKRGNDKAREIAETTWAEVSEKVGLGNERKIKTTRQSVANV